MIKIYTNNMGGVYFSDSETGHSSYIDEEATIIFSDEAEKLIPEDAQLIAEADSGDIIAAVKIVAHGLEAFAPQTAAE